MEWRNATSVLTQPSHRVMRESYKSLRSKMLILVQLYVGAKQYRSRDTFIGIFCFRNLYWISYWISQPVFIERHHGGLAWMYRFIAKDSIQGSLVRRCCRGVRYAFHPLVHFDWELGRFDGNESSVVRRIVPQRCNVALPQDILQTYQILLHRKILQS